MKSKSKESPKIEIQLESGEIIDFKDYTHRMHRKYLLSKKVETDQSKGLNTYNHKK